MFVTFDAPGPACLATELSPKNNLKCHLDVNANVFLALQGTHLESSVNLQLLKQTQHEQGFWQGYFYPSPLFTTLLVLDLLPGNPAFSAEAARALDFIASKQNADGSWGANGDCYETALAIAALAGYRAHPAAMNRGVKHLVSSAAADGSWTSDACIWKFAASEDDVWRAFDTHRAFVTARCMAALRRAAPHLST
jgi:hypothetical protein